MIEFARYDRVKAQGLVSVEPVDDGLCVCFKRFDPENGKEVSPERCLMTFAEIEAKAAELALGTKVIAELLAMKPSTNS